MSANYDMDLGVHSGETQELNIAYECFENLYQDEEVTEDAAAGNLWDDTMTHWESDDLEGSGDARPFFDNMKSIRYVPASSFILSYLAFKNSFPVSRDDLNRLNAFAEEFSSKYASETEAAKRKEFKKIMTGRLPVTKTGEPEPVESLLRELAERVRLRMTFFKELDNITKNGKWTEYFRGMLFSFDFSYLRDIAFAFDMDSQQFDVFLNKVLRRTWTNYFNREEILTHIVLQYSDSVQYTADRFQLYNDLCDKYKVRKTKAGHPEAFEKVKSEDAASKMVQEKVESMLTKIDLSGEDVFGYSPELHDILDWVYDRRKVLKRSAERVFNDELRKLLDKLSVEIKEQLSNKAEDVKDGADSGQKCSPLTMKYFAASDCVIRKGQRLIGNSNIRENGLAVEVIYETTEDVHLTAERRKKISVRVDPITNPLLNADSSAKNVKEKHVEGLFRLDSLPSSSPRYEVTDQYSSAEPLKLEVHPGNALHFTADEKAKKGTIDIICAPGTVIYKGTVLSFTYKGRAYQYRVRKDESAEFYSTVQLPVMLINADELWNKKSKKSSSYKKEIKVADTGSLIGFLGGTQSLGIRDASVINTKPISVEDPHALEKGKTKNVKANYHTLFRYLYGDEKHKYRGVTSYGPSFFLNTAEFKAAMLSYNSVSAFPKSEVKARNLLLTLSFLNFVSDDLSLYSYAPGVPRAQGLIDDFTTRCNAVMEKCGFMTLYAGNPYDEFLRRLLTSRSPMELYMSIFHDRHFLTQYIKVNIDAGIGEWNWKVVRSLSDGTEEIWGEGQEKKGAQTITLPRLVVRNGSKYRMIITCGDGKTEVRDIIINQLQEYEVSI